MSALTLWTEANNLAVRYESYFIISKKSTLRWKILHQEYSALKYLSNMINNVIGSNITCFLVSSILEYAMSFDEIISMGKNSTSHWIRWIVVGFYFLSAVAILLVSADICRQVCILNYLICFFKCMIT